MAQNRMREVVIDCFPQNALLYRRDYTMVAIDVIRATTTAITAVASGRRCFPASSVADALSLASQLNNPVLVGELGGNTPYGFDMTNSPAEIELRQDIERPMVLLSSAGTQLICESRSDNGTFLACFRNYSSLALYLSAHASKVAVLGAGTRGEFREEDEMCCAWIAGILMQSGFDPVNDRTIQIVNRWKGTHVDECLVSNSVEYLRNTGQTRDLDFVLNHDNDLNAVFRLRDREVVMLPVSRPADNQLHDIGKLITREI
jgi:2-phosphosulfolactate phosphatase